MLTEQDLEEETYVYPGTNQIIHDPVHLDIINKVRDDMKPGSTWVIDGRYVKIHHDWVEVEPDDPRNPVYIPMGHGHYRKVVRDGFWFRR